MGYNFLSYHTYYGAVGDVKIPEADRPCFGTLDRQMENIGTGSCTVTIYIRRNISALNNGWNNYCPFTTNEIHSHLKKCQRYVDFSFETREVPKDEHDTLLVILKFEKITRIKILFVCTWVRHLYEYPYNMALRDSMFLSHDISRESNVNLFNLVLSSFSFDNIHTFYAYNHRLPIFLSTKEIKSKLNRVERLNRIWAHLDKASSPVKGNLNSPNFWTYAKYKECRRSIYLENYKKLKE